MLKIIIIIKPSSFAKINNKNEKVETLQTNVDEKLNELELCEFHYERVKHFFCVCHKTITCRVCTQLTHNKKECMIVDLYEVEDIQEFLNNANFIGTDEAKLEKFLKENGNLNNENCEDDDNSNENEKSDDNENDNDDEYYEDLDDDENENDSILFFIIQSYKFFKILSDFYYCLYLIKFFNIFLKMKNILIN